VNYVFFLDGDSMIYMLGWSDISLKELKERIGNKHTCISSGFSNNTAVPIKSSIASPWYYVKICQFTDTLFLCEKDINLGMKALKLTPSTIRLGLSDYPWRIRENQSHSKSHTSACVSFKAFIPRLMSFSHKNKVPRRSK
jgi:hypothetical protein